MRSKVSRLAILALVTACGTSTLSTLPEISDAEAACVDFYRSVVESVEEEAVYMRVFADRIAEAGHTEASVILSDLADQWEVGVWNGDHDERWQSAIWAEAGNILADAGELRCADLAEWWGIDGYEGEPDPAEMLDRQRTIWTENALATYYLLVAGRAPADERYTQVQVKIVEGQIDAVVEVERALINPADLPKTIDEYYDLIQTLSAGVSSYNLVRSYPLRASAPDGTEYFVKLDTSDYPDPIVYFDDWEGGEENG